MNQMGIKPGATNSTAIDQLSYTYMAGSNKLQSVTDGVNDNSSTLGDFKYNSTTKTSTDYTYDVNGNMISDANKGITGIQYNFLNLPDTIIVAGKGMIIYTHDAMGTKLQKKTIDNMANKTTITNYFGGTIYQNDTLQYLPQEEGRIRVNATNNGFIFDYFIKDHLGNTRMVLTDDYNRSNPILESTHYYPFGLTMKGISGQAGGRLENKFKYNGIELNADLELNQYDAHYRNLDPQIGRSWQLDNKPDFTLSLYSAMNNSPVSLSDPLGDTVHVDKTITENRPLNNAFNAFANTKQGNKFLSNYAAKGQSIGGSTFNKDGKYSKKGVDLNYNSQSFEKSKGGETSTAIDIFGRAQINVSINSGIYEKTTLGLNTEIFDKVGTLFHESFIHVDISTKDFLDNNKFDNSNIGKNVKNIAGYGVHYQHYKVLIDYINQGYKTNNLWPGTAFSGLKQLNDFLKIFASDQKLLNDMWNYNGGIQLDENGKHKH
jgi:RHS repeat-associated protein